MYQPHYRHYKSKQRQRTPRYRVEDEIVIRFPTDEFYRGDFSNGVMISGSRTEKIGDLMKKIEIDLGGKNGKRTNIQR